MEKNQKLLHFSCQAALLLARLLLCCYVDLHKVDDEKKVESLLVYSILLLKLQVTNNI